MKLFSSLGLNITFLQDFSRSAGSSLVSWPCHWSNSPSPAPCLLFRTPALSVCIIFAHLFGYRRKLCFVCEWPQGLLKQLPLNPNCSSLPRLKEGQCVLALKKRTSKRILIWSIGPISYVTAAFRQLKVWIRFSSSLTSRMSWWNSNIYCKYS